MASLHTLHLRMTPGNATEKKGLNRNEETIKSHESCIFVIVGVHLSGYVLGSKRYMIFTHTPVTLAIYGSVYGEASRLDLLLLGFFSMAPDLDHFLPNGLRTSRVVLHNLPALIIILAITILINRRIFAQALAGYGSHILIDLADRGGVALLYPLTRQRYALKIWVSPEPSYTTLKGLPLDLALSGTFIAIFLILTIYRKRKAKKMEKEEGL